MPEMIENYPEELNAENLKATARNLVQKTATVTGIAIKSADIVESIAIGAVVCKIVKRACPANAKWYVKLGYAVAGYAIGECLVKMNSDRLAPKIYRVKDLITAVENMGTEVESVEEEETQDGE